MDEVEEERVRLEHHRFVFPGLQERLEHEIRRHHLNGVVEVEKHQDSLGPSVLTRRRCQWHRVDPLGVGCLLPDPAPDITDDFGSVPDETPPVQEGTGSSVTLL